MDKALYFLAIIPPDPLEKELYALKQKLSEQYQTFSALKSPSHITVLAPFWLEKDQRAELATLLGKVALLQHTFSIELSGYERFGERTLFVDVKPCTELLRLHEDVKRLVQNVLDNPFPAREFTPHLTLLNRDITPENFRKAWQEFNGRHYEACFNVQAMSLLELKGPKWEVVNIFTFR